MSMIFSDVFKIITNMDIFPHDELVKLYIFLKRKYEREKKSHLSFTQSAALHPAANYASSVSKPTDDYLEAERGCKLFLDNFGFFRIF